MNKTYINRFPARGWMKMAATLALLVAGPASQAQQGSTGNTYIFGGAQMTFFGAHDFANGGSGALPGIIGTVRSAAYGVLNFSSTASHNGGADAAHVDGYVRKYGTTPFVFPIGDNGFYGPFAASGDGTTGAYFHGNATVAVTSDLGGGNYPVLPLGGPFATTLKEAAVAVVSTIEYWDIDGSSATPITLTWDAGSDVTTLTGSQLNKLTIAGWDGSQWVAIPSVVDVTSVLGGASDLTAGSLTSSAGITPDTYTAYTLASLVNPLPVTLLSFAARPEENMVSLNWATTSETNSDRFEIERSSSGKDFNKIGLLASHKESNELKTYTFVDKTPSNGENLYRLKMIDKDGSFAYSRIRSVKFELALELTAYPNPVREKLLIRNSDLVKEATLYTMSGLVISSGMPVSAQGIDVSRLSAGLYHLKITLSDGTQNVQKIVIAR